MTGQPAVSIIVPIYNGESYINKIFNNFSKIKNNDIEVILIDDGSKDGSWERLKRVCSSDARFRIYHKENSGIADTRNYGIREAKGRYCYFFDQDDEVVNEELKELIKVLDKDESDFCIANSGVVLNDQKFEENCIIEKSEVIYRPKIDQLIVWLIGNGTISCDGVPKIKTTVWNCLFRKSFLDKHNIVFEKFMDFEDDWVFLIRCLLHADKVNLENKCVYYWRINPESESHSHKYVENFYPNRKKLKKFIDETLNAINVSENKRKDFEVMFQRRTFLWGLYNECYGEQSLSKKIENVRQIVELEVPKIRYPLLDTGYSKKENMLLRLLLSKHCRCAYFVNKAVFGFHFH